jgi:hypothetical protein
MSAAYQHLALTQVQPGMILSDDLVDQQGQILLPQGAVLTVQTIALLPRHGIEMLAVLRVDGPPEHTAGIDPAVTQRRLDHLFRTHDADQHEDWASRALRRFITAYRLEREIEP